MRIFLGSVYTFPAYERVKFGKFSSRTKVLNARARNSWGINGQRFLIFDRDTNLLVTYLTVHLSQEALPLLLDVHYPYANQLRSSSSISPITPRSLSPFLSPFDPVL
jgi:hypothetical protein